MDKKRLQSFLTGAAIMLVIAAMVVINGRWSLRNCSNLRGPRPGKPAPGFALARYDGKANVRLAELRGKVVVLDFWATWCGPCLRKIPLLEQMQSEWAARGLQVVGINVDASHQIERLRRYFARRGSKSNLLALLGNSRVAALYGVRTLPHVAVIDRRGKLVHVQIGTPGHDRLRAAVKAALDEK